MDIGKIILYIIGIAGYACLALCIIMVFATFIATY